MERYELISDVVLAADDRVRVILPAGTVGVVSTDSSGREAAREAAATRMDLAFLEAERAITRIEMLRKARAGAGAYEVAERKLAEAEKALHESEKALAEFDRPMVRLLLDSGLCVLAEPDQVRPVVSVPSQTRGMDMITRVGDIEPRAEL